jgi:hypothetical protein
MVWKIIRFLIGSCTRSIHCLTIARSPFSILFGDGVVSA